MAEEIGFENGRNSNFEGLVTLTLDPAILCGRTDVRTDRHFPPLILLGRLLEVDLKNTHKLQSQE